ncbi:addiction module protein [Nostoc sp. C057]|uniref:addiction module protein n=1 Tax=Nostoc sp. C057 TaxID=2576903 RepID=UPI00211810E1|nr:addiction module protein [Nostoc sp. C057]
MDKILSAIFKVYQLLPHSKLISIDITATLNEIATLSVEDRIRIVQAIWDSIAAEQVYPDLTDAQKQELDRRTADYDSNPDNVLTWEEIKASIKGQQRIMSWCFAQRFEKNPADAHSWYESQKPGLGDEFLDCVDETVNLICQMPESYAVTYRDVRRAIVRRFPYAVYYRIVSSRVIVTAIFHGRRDPKS